ncbi:MAG: M56 family metallopeptidase [Gemmatimonadales bacterium]
MRLALVWTLVHVLWQGAAIAALVALARSTIPAARADRRHRAALAGLAALLLLPPLTWLGLTGLSSAAAASGALPIQAIDRIGPATTAAITARRLALDFSSISAWIVTAWLIGSAAVAASLLGGALVGWRRRRTARPARGSWQPIADRLTRGYGLRRPVPVLVASGVTDPVVSGILRPVVLLPGEVERRLAPGEIEAVLAHELAHVARRDQLATPLLAAAGCLLFFQPAARWLARAVEAERERATDDLALRQRIDPLAYARALSRLEEIRRGVRRPRIALAARGGNLLERVRRITLGTPPPDRRATTRAGLLALALATLGSVGAVPLSLAVLTGRSMTITATDPAGSFTMQFLDGRLVRARVGDLPLAPERWSQRGPVVVVHATDADLPFTVRVQPDGISWQPRAAVASRSPR